MKQNQRPPAVNWGFKFMLVLKQHPQGGPKLKPNSFPLAEDKQGNFGLKLGYLEDGEPILIALRDAENFGSQFGLSLSEYKKLVKKNEPRVPIHNKVAYWLLGKRAYHKVMQEGFEVD